MFRSLVVLVGVIATASAASAQDKKPGPKEVAAIRACASKNAEDVDAAEQRCVFRLVATPCTKRPDAGTTIGMADCYRVEQMIWDDDGRLANPSLADYKIPGLYDVPRLIEPIIFEDPDPTGPFGAKGVGEIAMAGVAPAIANALAQAAGIRLRRLPMTPERVVDALDGA